MSTATRLSAAMCTSSMSKFVPVHVTHPLILFWKRIWNRSGRESDQPNMRPRVFYRQ